MKNVQKLGVLAIDTCVTLGRAGIMLATIVCRHPPITRGHTLLRRQFYAVGAQSLIIIAASGLFIGMVIGLQGYSILSRYGAGHTLGEVVALSLLRELGPVVTGLLFAGCAGSAITAEIGLMKANEELACLEVMAVDPLRRIVSPRFWAGVISMPLLGAIFTAIGIWGSAKVGIDWKGIDAGQFWSVMSSNVSWHKDLFNGFIKSLVFATTTSWIAIFNGYDASPTPMGINLATTRTVVHSSLAILGLDFILTAFMFGR